MKKFTERQLWDILRHSVGSNNTFLRKIFTASVSAHYNYLKDRNPSDSYYLERQKNYSISNGMKNIYKAFADKFFEYDYDGGQDAIGLTLRKEVWLDNISTKDLYYYYCLQQNVFDRVKNFDHINEDSIIRQIENTDNEFLFSGKVDFSGKPQKTSEERGVKIDLDDYSIRQEALITVALSEYEKFCSIRGLDFEGTKEQFLQSQRYKSITFSGYVVKTYFQERQKEQNAENTQIEQVAQQTKKPQIIECSPEESKEFDEAIKKYERHRDQIFVKSQKNNVEESGLQEQEGSQVGSEQLTIFDYYKDVFQ